MDSSEELLRFLYLCPVGVVEIDDAGAIAMLNALASQLLMPLAAEPRLDNLFELLSPFDAELQKKVAAHSGGSGQVCAGHRVSLTRNGAPVHLDFTVIRLETRRLMVAFDDVTRLVLAEEAAKSAIEIQARQAGKLEIAGGVLHDIGNAITGLGARGARLNADCERAELVQLERLGELFRGHASELEAALGAAKASALHRFIAALTGSLRARFDDWDDSARLLTRTVKHIQQILNIQRTYAGLGPADLATVSLDDVLGDVIAIQSGALSKHRVTVRRALQPDLPRVRADRTKLVQVLINVVKNACEAFDEPAAPGDGRFVEIAARRADDGVEIEVADNGCGFASWERERLMKRGESRKPGGSGLGLCGARDLLQLQGGDIEISSPGPGLGATVRITLPLPAEVS